MTKLTVFAYIILPLFASLSLGFICTPVLSEVSLLSQQVFPGSTWEFRTPAQLELDNAKLDQFIAQVGGQGAIVRNGYMVKTWGSQTSKSTWGSASKPVTSTMLFFAVHEGKLSSVDDLIKNWGWALSTKDQTMTFRHLANNISGYTLMETPGAAWAYNDYGINLYLKTMYTRVFTDTGGANPADSAARHPARLGALQFQDGSIFMPWTDGGWEVNASVRDFARIGWFWLSKGNWRGQQLLPESLFDAYMKPGVPASLPRASGNDPDGDYLGVGTNGGGNNDTPLGPGVYGLNLWHNPNRSFWTDAPADAFQANGHWNGEVMTVIPSLGIVALWKGGGGNSENNFNVRMNDHLRVLVSAVITTIPAAPTGLIVR